MGHPGACLRACIRLLDVPCLYVQSVATKYDTDDSSIRQVFDHARELTPCCLVFEDLDAMITSEVTERLAEETDAFSFAYVKELFVSSMVRWMAGPRARSIAPILFEQLATLRQQMRSDASRPPEPPIDASSGDEE